MCALHRWERGCYEMDGPVTEWWPEFGRAGKDRVTAAHLLSHQAGLPALDTPVSVDGAADAGALAAMLASDVSAGRRAHRLVEAVYESVG